MQTLSRGFLLMMINMLSANWSGGINRLCEACCDNSLERTSRSPMICHRKLSCELTGTSAASVVKRVFPPGFIGSRIIPFEKTRGGGKSSDHCAGSRQNKRARTGDDEHGNDAAEVARESPNERASWLRRRWYRDTERRSR